MSTSGLRVPLREGASTPERRGADRRAHPFDLFRRTEGGEPDFRASLQLRDHAPAGRSPLSRRQGRPARPGRSR
jgi:hypothetical protein